MKNIQSEYALLAFLALGALLLFWTRSGSDAPLESPDEALPAKASPRGDTSGIPARRPGETKSADSMRRAVRGHLALTDPKEQRESLEEILAALAPGNAEATIRSWMDGRGMPGTWDAAVKGEYAALLSAWGGIDGAAAMAFAEGLELGLNHRGWSRNSVIKGWGYKNSDEAFAWVKENADGDGPLIQQLLWGMASRDIGAATDYVLAAPDDLNAGVYIDRLARHQWAQGGGEGAAGWLRQLPEGALKGRALHTIADFLAKENPQEAAQWVAQFSGSESAASAVAQIADVWAAGNPRQATAWATGLAAGEGRDRAIREAVVAWARSSPEAAAEFVETLESGPVWDAAARAYGSAVMRVDPEAGMEWAESIGALERRHEAVDWQMRMWMRRDHPAANAWLESSELPAAVVEKIRADHAAWEARN